MGHALDFIKFMINNYQTIIQGLLGVCAGMTMLCSALAGIFLMIPSQQPEAFVKSIGDFFHRVSDFLAKFSKKPADAPVVPPSDQPKV